MECSKELDGAAEHCIVIPAEVFARVESDGETVVVDKATQSKQLYLR
jgi:hypothetical protein